MKLSVPCSTMTPGAQMETTCSAHNRAANAERWALFKIAAPIFVAGLLSAMNRRIPARPVVPLPAPAAPAARPAATTAAEASCVARASRLRCAHAPRYAHNAGPRSERRMRRPRNKKDSERELSIFHALEASRVTEVSKSLTLNAPQSPDYSSLSTRPSVG